MDLSQHKSRADVTVKRKQMFIHGKWTDARSGKTLSVYDPASGEVIANVPDAGPEDIDAAVRSARSTFESAAWRDMIPAQRERLLLNLADLIERNGEELARLETLNNGKLLMFSRMLEVGANAQWVRYMAGWATKIEGATLDVSIPFPPGTKYSAMTRREPVGVVGAIVPWNFPLLMAMWKIAPALACGCTVVLKPAEETPLTALRLAELVMEAGFPAGAVNVVTGFGETAGAALVKHPGISKIAFTGSTEVGKVIGRNCMDDMKRVSLELGGKSPVIVLEDCDPAVAVQGAAGAIFFNHGQVCTAGSRLYVHKSRYEKVVGGIAEVAKATKLGSGFDETTQMGPLVSKHHRERVLGFIESGKKEGAELLAGGAAASGPGYFVSPTVFANTSGRELTICREEIFGPVLVAMPFSDVDDLVRQANATAYGLGASLWTNNLTAAYRLIPRIEAGTVWVNCHNMVDPNLPFGGYKQSGNAREHGRAMIDLYTETKSVCVA
jgi:phenylacetaldehyde dehydrogenase